MKKYWVIFKNGLQMQLVYRANFFVSFIAEGLSLLVMAYLWLSIYRDGRQIGSYSLSGIIMYYVLTKFVGIVITSNIISKQLNMLIKQGELNNYLIKPISLLYRMFFLNIGESIFRLFVFAVAVLPWIIFFGHGLHLASIIFFAISLIIALIINFLIFYLVGILTFYLDDIQGLATVASVITSFLSGYILPVDILPAYLQHLIRILPFKYTMYVPIKIITDQMNQPQIYYSLFYGFIWVIALYSLNQIVYRRGLKKYEGVSG